VAAAALLLLACTISFVSFSRALGTISEDRFKDAEAAAEGVVSQSQSMTSGVTSAANQLDAVNALGRQLVGGVEGRVQWLELFKGISACFPYDPPGQLPEDISKRNTLYITSLDCFHMEQLEDWFASRHQWYVAPGSAPAASTAPAAPTSPTPVAAGTTPGAPPAMASGAAGPAVPNPGGPPPPGGLAPPASADAAAPVPTGDGPTGPGWVIQLRGYHYHNLSGVPDPQFLQDARYVRETLIKGLEGDEIKVPLPVVGPDGEKQVKLVSMKELGVSHPVLINPGRVKPSQIINPNVKGAGRPGAMGGPGYGGMYEEMDEGAPMGMYSPTGRRPSAAADGEEEEESPVIDVMVFEFTVEFAWKPRLSSEEEAQDAEGQTTELPSEAQT
jgi:hypothetical protein